MDPYGGSFGNDQVSWNQYDETTDSEYLVTQILKNKELNRQYRSKYKKFSIQDAIDRQESATPSIEYMTAPKAISSQPPQQTQHHQTQTHQTQTKLPQQMQARTLQHSNESSDDKSVKKVYFKFELNDDNLMMFFLVIIFCVIIALLFSTINSLNQKISSLMEFLSAKPSKTSA
jgi:hypothetical protein